MQQLSFVIHADSIQIKQMDRNPALSGSQLSPGYVWQFFVRFYFHMLLSLSIWNLRCMIMCSKCRLHFSCLLYCVTKQEIEFFPRVDIVSYFLLLLSVCDWPSMRWHLKGICRGSLCLCPKYQVKTFRNITSDHRLKFLKIFFCLVFPPLNILCHLCM